MNTAIPTHLVMGFLGTGKTTLLRHLLAHKPEHERWAILVNEFGEVGIDGALLSEQGALVKEIPGGCLCCVAGLPFQIGLNALLHKAQPDRLLIEPTGLGHPSRVMDILTNEHYRNVLSLGAAFCLIDPRQWQDSRYREHETYRDQLALADVVVANKTDMCSEAELSRLRHDIAQGPEPKQVLVETEQGRLDLNWLTHPHAPERRAAHPQAHAGKAERPMLAAHEPPLSPARPWRRYGNHGDDHFSVGWRFLDEVVFDLDALRAFCEAQNLARLKAVVRTADGWWAFNQTDRLSVYRLAPQKESRIELIDASPLAAAPLHEQLMKTVISLPSS
ncbi:GTP-binding protein [Oceanimonas sp. NS1]|uniref:Cobalamin biosynthesis protein n=1 Tax=Oceanimonas doudoroffii TaxID=84158 RepID=A0A233RDV2_9GAMM|nr:MULTISPECIES: GTP-binding protein [Oceanimonas]MCT7654705.1 GTP-binding protein [Oceanimonas sp. NS1]NHH99121.1 Zinc-binding GTPase YeiR [Oceanimonas sp. MB9]OXY81571.1 cobalamin biosynthesis protein [Oceanimonas doudoroffii]